MANALVEGFDCKRPLVPYAKVVTSFWRHVFLFILSLFAFFFLLDSCSIGRYSLNPWGRRSSTKLNLQSYQPAGGFHWSHIEPTENIRWHKCYSSFYCAKVKLPLDYQNASNPNYVSIPLLRYPAKSNFNYAGPIFINPGGPGGSGVFFLKFLAEHYQTIAGKNHDIISFDPRGVGLARPLMDCWDGDEISRRIWELSSEGAGTVDSHEGVIYDVYARAKASSMICLRSSAAAENGIGRFMSTANAARDMLEILTLMGEENLKYWGFSYGTVLGTTFASLYPEKVDKMVNDGNVDVRRWMAGDNTRFVEDADNVMRGFYKYCHLSGPSKCAFYASSPSAIEERLDSLLETLRKYPFVTLPKDENTHRKQPSITTYSKVRQMIATSFYQPILTFPQLSRTLTALSNGSVIPESAKSGVESSISSPATPAVSDFQTDSHTEAHDEISDGTEDAFRGVLCSESDVKLHSPDDFEEYAMELMRLSKSTGATMVGEAIGCVGWDIAANWRFTGPFTGNTSTPLLFVSNMYDPITPVSSAVNNAAGFSGSSVLIQEAYGHTTLSTPSRCTARAIRSYFQHGIVPQNGTMCDVDVTPFADNPVHVEMAAETNDGQSDDAELDIALWRLMEGPRGR